MQGRPPLIGHRASLFSILLLLLVSQASICVRAADLASYVVDTQIVPDALDEAPKELLSVSYGGKQVQVGEEWTPTACKDPPTIDMHYDPAKFYTLIMTDIDAPKRSKPTYREFLAWCVVNIPGDHFAAGQVLAEYSGIGPPKDSGEHRVLFTLYEQQGSHEYDEKFIDSRQLGWRLWFSQRNFSNRHGMANDGQPVAAAVLVANYDQYSDKLADEFKKRLKM
ncbi:protein D1-like [Trichogramma pretiosum]|uniref:protein D1-like n=1 Tax=Trichogramma pretiosum TaxID=7493 RepID=UPI0006C99928|nr:protein D1-like [Trichogramma pretiosum]